ncbi:hypothetical protein ACFYXF_22670 [Streptomyces sp. NPDC002680]|uniref:hypothetical protein n=1 Tax=Streptomyces sp. NPDC002680 TaxID=3364659 RepID=UPI00367A26A0
MSPFPAETGAGAPHEPVRELVLVAGLSHADIALVHREALRALRSGIDTAHLDAYGDDPGMAIGVDVRDDEQFELLV